MERVRIESANLQEPGLVDALFALLRESYGQEARLLELEDFAPLRRERASLTSDGNHFLIASEATSTEFELLGALELECNIGNRDREQIDVIASLVVSPGHQRRGIATGLVERALEISAAPELVVSTARKNLPALALYGRLGFSRQGSSTREGIELVHFRRSVDRAKA